MQWSERQAGKADKAMFAATVRPLVEALKKRPGERAHDLVTFYLDHGVLAGTLNAVADALQTVARESVRLGLQLDLSKCELILPAGCIPCHITLETLFLADLLQDLDTKASRVVTSTCWAAR